MREKVIVLGKGFLGKEFERKGYVALGKEEFYITPKNSQEVIEQLRDYDVIINCTGKSNTRWCEKRENFQQTMFSNGEVPKLLSDFSAKYGKKFVHISTGCLHDNNKFPQKENDFIVAHCNYTLSKWVGEMGCNPEKDLILRPRLYFGDFKDKNNLLCKLPNFKNFLDELNSYTSVGTIVDAVSELLKAEQKGIFNVACDGFATVWEMANWIGISGGKIKEKELHKKENLFLVNNILDISKLRRFYQPPKLEKEVIRCWEKLND